MIPADASSPSASGTTAGERSEATSAIRRTAWPAKRSLSPPKKAMASFRAGCEAGVRVSRWRSESSSPFAFPLVTRSGHGGDHVRVSGRGSWVAHSHLAGDRHDVHVPCGR